MRKKKENSKNQTIKTPSDQPNLRLKRVEVSKETKNIILRDGINF